MMAKLDRTASFREACYQIVRAAKPIARAYFATQGIYTDRVLIDWPQSSALPAKVPCKALGPRGGTLLTCTISISLTGVEIDAPRAAVWAKEAA